MSSAHSTVGELLRRRASDPQRADRLFLLSADGAYSWRETWTRSKAYANAFLAWRRRDDLPLHVGVLVENRPEFVFAFFGCALAGGVLVGLNPTHRGTTLASDIDHCDCQLVLTEEKFLDPLVEALQARESVRPEHIWVLAPRTPDLPLPYGMRWLDEGLAELEKRLGDELFLEPEVAVRPEDWVAIIFTSGSTGAPKAILISHRKMLSAGAESSSPVTFSDEDVFYASMPLFHSNSLGLALIPALVHAGKLAMARRFTARGFLHDVRRYGATVWNYVGKPFAYILATPERSDDADNPLRAAVGAGASARQQDEFQRRFGVEQIAELYGSTEAGAGTVRRPDDPPGSVGEMPPHVRVLDAQDRECPPAEVDASGKVLNYEDAVGEIVNVEGPGLFEGYYKNTEATAEKMRDGKFRSGDLAYYRIFDRDGEPTRFLYYVGRTHDWIRKDGENFVAEPIEEILMRHPDVLVSCVYGVPCPEGDEHVMAALIVRDQSRLNPEHLYEFLESQPDMSPKWMPDYLRLSGSLPRTETLKILRPTLKREGFDPRLVGDPVWWRERGETGWKPFSETDYARVVEAFVDAGREQALRSAQPHRAV